MANPKLHEIIAVVSGKKSAAEKAVTELYKKIQKPDLFDGLQRTYQPLDETSGEKIPAERKNPQLKTDEVIKEAAESWSSLFNLTATLDRGNRVAKGEIIVVEDQKPLVSDLPVSTLLFLDKQLSDIKAFVEALPTPDPAEQWKLDNNSGCLVTDPVETIKTKKIESHIVVVPATPEHPAQVVKAVEDKTVGHWTTVKQTTKLPANQKDAMLKRVKLLIDAVKTARERANGVEVKKSDDVGSAILGFIFGDYAK